MAGPSVDFSSQDPFRPLSTPLHFRSTAHGNPVFLLEQKKVTISPGSNESYFSRNAKNLSRTGALSLNT